MRRNTRLLCVFCLLGVITERKRGRVSVRETDNGSAICRFNGALWETYVSAGYIGKLASYAILACLRIINKNKTCRCLWAAKLFAIFGIFSLFAILA